MRKLLLLLPLVFFCAAIPAHAQYVEIALGYILGAVGLSLLGWIVEQIGRLNVRLVVKLLREQAPVQEKEQTTKLQEASD